MQDIIIEYTGERESFKTIDFWYKGEFVSAMQSYRFSFTIENDEDLCGRFRVLVYYKGTTFLFSIYCDEINITNYICDDAGNIISKEERILKVD